MKDNNFLQYQEESKIDIKEILLKYLRFWPLYLIGVIIALTVAKIQLRYAANIYATSATIKIKNESNEADIDLTVLPPGGNFFNKGINLYDQIEIIKSKRLLAKMISDNQMETFYYSKGKVRTSELWGKNQPFIVLWFKSDTLKEIPSSPMFGVVFTSENTYNLMLGGQTVKENLKVGEKTQYTKYEFSLNKIPGNDYEARAKNQTLFSFQYKTPLQRAASLSKQLSISFVNKKSEILSLRLLGPDENKNRYLLNKIVEYYDEDSQDDKKQVARKTQEFVESRIDSLILDLDRIESRMVNYMQGESYYSEEWYLQKYATQEGQYYGAEHDLRFELELIDALYSNLNKTDPFQLIPANIGIESASINTMIEEYNALVLSRERLLLVTTEKHPDVILTSQQITNARDNFIRSLDEYKSTLKDKVNKYAEGHRNAQGELYTIPAKEKALRNIIRQQSIKEELYLFLLEKRETAALTSAVISPSMKVVDYAYTNPGPVSPNRKSKYIISFFIGLVIPISLVYLRFLLDTKVHTKEDVTKNLGPNIPIVGEIPLIPKTSNWLTTKNDRSELAESFRVVRTNLDYMMSGADKESRKIIVTSSTKSEGKTFASLNTALSLASGNHKVLLVGADLRNPQLHQAFEMDKNVPGLTTFLHDTEADLNDLIQKSMLGFETLDVILSGFIPPNPAELLLNGRFEQLLNQVKHSYEYIIIDSAPTVLVTDTLLLSQYADVCLYMVRSGVTDTKVLEHIGDLVKLKKLPHLGILLNGVGHSGAYGYKYQYNYGYGYAYGEKQESKRNWLKKILFPKN